MAAHLKGNAELSHKIIDAYESTITNKEIEKVDYELSEFILWKSYILEKDGLN